MKKLFLLFPTLLLLLMAFVSAESVFYDHFDNNNFTSEGWTSILGNPDENDTFIFSGDNANSRVYQQFTNISFMDEDWNLSVLTRTDQFTRLIFSNTTDLSATRDEIKFIFDDENILLSCSSGNCNCDQIGIQGDTSDSLYWEYNLYFSASNNSMEVYRNNTWKGSSTVSNCNMTDMYVLLEMRKTLSEFDSFDLDKSPAPEVNKPPVISLISPTGDIHTNKNVTLQYKVVDPDTAVSNCTVKVDGTLNQTETNLANNTQSEFNITFTVDGMYDILLECTDGQTTDNETFEVFFDMNDPFIALAQPSIFNTTTYTNNLITIDGNVTNIELDVVNLSVYNTTGGLILNLYNNSFPPLTTTYLFLETINTTYRDNGVWSMNVFANDTTSNENNKWVSFTVNNCVPNWACNDFMVCNISDLAGCNETIDLNNCSLPYDGNITELEQPCNYCTATIRSYASPCNSVTDEQNFTVIDETFSTCCNVTKIWEDCGYWGVNESFTFNSSCSIFDYSEDDLTKASLSTITKFLIALALFVPMIIVLLVYIFVQRKYKQSFIIK